MKFILITFLLLIGLGACTSEKKTPTATHAEQTTSEESTDSSSPILKSKNDVLYRHFSVEPASLNPFRASDVYSGIIFDYVFDTLLRVDEDTFELKPNLAHKYEVGPKDSYYIFHLRKNATFSDGTKVTAEDVKFSYDAVMNPKFKAARLQPYFENIKSAEILSPHKIKFTIKKRYFNNLRTLGWLNIVPKHYYKDSNAKRNKVILGSGPYVLHKYDRGRSITLKKNHKWWGNEVSSLKKIFPMKFFMFRFIREDNIILESLKKGRIDYAGLSPEQYVKKTSGHPWGKTVFKEKVINKEAKGYGYVGWNLRKPLFKDKQVRRALAHLMDRKQMNDKFRFGMSLLATGPWYQQSDYASPKVKPISFDLKKATKMLNKAGWNDTDKDGILDKKTNGQKRNFRFTLMFASPTSEKYLTIYKESLRKAGVVAELKQVEWNSLVKALDERKFDAVMLGWSGTVETDPKQIWHSSSIKGGSNYIGYNNETVDRLIDKGRVTVNRKKRIQIFQKVYQILAEDAPYVFLFNEKFTMYGYNKRIRRPKPTFRYTIGINYWTVTPY